MIYEGTSEQTCVQYYVDFSKQQQTFVSHFTIRMNSRTFNKVYRFIDVGMHFKWHIVNSAVKKKKTFDPPRLAFAICGSKEYLVNM